MPYCNTFSGSSIGVKCAVIVGGMDMMSQALTLAKKPHILIATPGRLVDHLENTKGFSLRSLKFLVSFMSVSIVSTHLFQIGEPLLHISCYWICTLIKFSRILLHLFTQCLGNIKALVHVERYWWTSVPKEEKLSHNKDGFAWWWDEIVFMPGHHVVKVYRWFEVNPEHTWH